MEHLFYMVMSGLIATSNEKNLCKMTTDNAGADADKQTRIKQTTGKTMSNTSSDNRMNTKTTCVDLNRK